MEFVQMFLVAVLLIQVVPIYALTEDIDVGLNAKISNETLTAYNLGVHLGIINPDKYTLESFEHDQPIFKDSYAEFISWKETEPMTYQEWLVMNSYGLIVQTSEAIFQNKTNARSKKHFKDRFSHTVKTEDILISSISHSGLIGHAVIMVNDNRVLEMAGGSNWMLEIRDNNRQISKGDWYDQYCPETTTVYRCPDGYKAEQAAHWADLNYFNKEGGSEKTIHVTYKLTADFKSRNPSYSSKLVLHLLRFAYYFGTSDVIREVPRYGLIIVPTSIPEYFMPPYTLDIVGKF